MEPLVTIVVPNWNTGPLLRLCVASVLGYTRVPFRLVVVDNASTDASRALAEAAAARGLIDLVRRDDARNEGAPDHAAALDAGLAVAESPLVFTLDSDAWARGPGWLTPYLEALGDDASHAGALKFPSGRVKRAWDWVRGRRPGPEARYVRPCHALYRVAPVRELGLSFAPWQGEDGRWRTTGERLHEQLVAAGRRPAILSHRAVEAVIGHVRHSTMVLNAAHYPGLRRRTRVEGEARLRRLLASREAQSILALAPVAALPT